MLFEAYFGDDETRSSARVRRLASYHVRGHSLLIWILFLALAAALYWAYGFHIDQVARAGGEVIASSRVQIIQSVDGGVLAQLHVKEGDRVEPGQVIARLDQTRIGAAVKEIEARLTALKAKTARLRAEVIEADRVIFPDGLARFPELLQLESALFEQKRRGLAEELDNLAVAVELAREEADLIARLGDSGDANRGEVIRSQRALNEARAKVITRRNRYFEQARSELTRAEDEIAQNEQILTQRRRQLADSVFISQVRGIVKNIRVTTVGGVLRAGEELMQIIPLDDQLILEAKVSPLDIALVRPGLKATLRFDPYDYTIFGGVAGTVSYVSADTLKEPSGQGEEIYYRVHVTPDSYPVITGTGRELEILPGMTASVDIKTGQRTVLEYLLKPLRKTLAESLGER